MGKDMLTLESLIAYASSHASIRGVIESFTMKGIVVIGKEGVKVISIEEIESLTAEANEKEEERNESTANAHEKSEEDVNEENVSGGEE